MKVKHQNCYTIDEITAMAQCLVTYHQHTANFKVQKCSRTNKERCGQPETVDDRGYNYSL